MNVSFFFFFLSPEMSHMDSDLVGSACLNDHFVHAQLPVKAKGADTADRPAPVRNNCHALPVQLVT
jgi:hypothetical protein